MAEALKILRASAASGVPTLGDMTRDFRETSGAIIAADRELPGGGWVRSALNSLSGLATIRNTDPNAAKGTDRIVALAERALNEGRSERRRRSARQTDRKTGRGGKTDNCRGRPARAGGKGVGHTA